MTIDEIEATALSLENDQRAALAAKLLDSLDHDDDPEEVERAWVEEALRRSREIDAGRATVVPLEDVLRRLRGHSS